MVVPVVEFAVVVVLPDEEDALGMEGTVPGGLLKRQIQLITIQ